MVSLSDDTMGVNLDILGMCEQMRIKQSIFVNMHEEKHILQAIYEHDKATKFDSV